MKSKILNVSLTRKKANLSYPIIVGDDLLSNGGEILKESKLDEYKINMKKNQEMKKKIILIGLKKIGN